tara:strand:+ start:585 stop:1106 length:522 start_codon:yes stop_codon:yes gene_type:complete
MSESQLNVTNTTSEPEVSTSQSHTASSSSAPQVFSGRCKWFNNRRGYGFLTVDQNSVPAGTTVPVDVFVHQTNVCPATSTYRTLRQGEYVSFRLENDSNGSLHAVHVTGINGGPLFCDSNVRRSDDSRPRPSPSDGRRNRRKEPHPRSGNSNEGHWVWQPNSSTSSSNEHHHA